MKKLLLSLLVLLLAVGFAFAGGSGEKEAQAPAPAETTPAPAPAEVTGGTLSAYTTLEEPLARKLFEQFEAETGIKVSFVRLTGGEAVARMKTESANPQASIWVGGVGL